MPDISLEGAAILVVDDQQSNLELLGELLTRQKYRVMSALGGRQALLVAAARKPELVLLDMRMPDLSGIEVCRRLHKLEGLGDVPVVFLTAATDHDSLVEAFSVGAADYLVKPFVADELLARVRTHLTIKRSRARLAALAREREDLTIIVAHDLKNPLANIRFAAKLLQQRDIDDDSHQLAEDILASANEALSFIKRYLGTRERGEQLRALEVDSFDLAELAAEAASLQKAAAKAADVGIVIDDGDTVLARGDRMATRNVLQNLLANAIHHSPRGSNVHVVVERSYDGSAQCLVLDRGPGISSRNQELLFKRFARLASEGRPNNSQSTGLGLAIAKHDIDAMHGHLWYEPRAGGGSAFGFVLPMGEEPRADVRA
ncbi:MAG TPA: hybrid sensor histidine kinase/response regulator [Rhodanobacteraceae bacterium]|nr:hybrid sensor histidine kinase/response regulator [Rhodanobacteraceae bacterium]